MKTLIALIILAVVSTISAGKIDRTGEIAYQQYASVGGKYSVLLHILEVPQDTAYYGEYYDYGYWEGDSYGGYTQLSTGYWVYVSPKWYVWQNVNNLDDGCGG